MTGTLHGIGIGPGDPELMTLKGHRLLQSVPVIAYPAPEKGDSLARSIAAPHIPKGRIEMAMPIPFDPDPMPARAAYDRHAEAIAAHLGEGRDVAVLCEGDPLFYGSFQYLLVRLGERFPCQVVPGVSSSMAAAAALCVPMCARNQVLSVIPAPLPEEVIVARLEQADAAVLMKVGRHLAKVRRALARAGLMDAARYVGHATMAEQSIRPLAELGDDEAPYFSLILVNRNPKDET